MSWRLNRVQMYMLSGVCVAILLLFAGLYYLFISPMKSTIETKKTEVETQQTVLDSISSKFNHSNGTAYQSTMELQKKLPVKPLGDQLILDFEKAEVVSNSLILKMEVKDEELAGDEEVQSTQTEDEAAETSPSDSTDGAANSDGDPNSEAEQTAAPLPLPQGVKRLTVKVTVEAFTYDQIQTFIETIESSKRILKVDSIEFVGTEEVVSIEQSTEPLVYTLGISAFYSPDLIDLENHLPYIETPAPADKDNPLSIAPDVTKK